MQRRAFIQITAASLTAGLTPLASAVSASAATQKGQNMIIVTFEVEFKDDQIQTKLDAIRAMDEATAKEDGCITYKSSFDANNPRVLRIYEMWESMDALIPHFKTPHMATFQTALAGLEPKNMEAKVYEVARELPFPN